MFTFLKNILSIKPKQLTEQQKLDNEFEEKFSFMRKVVSKDSFSRAKSNYGLYKSSLK